MTLEQRELLRKLAGRLEDYDETRRYADAITAALDEQDRLRAEHANMTANLANSSILLERQQRHFAEDETQLRAEIAQMRAARTYDDLNAIRGIVEAVQRGDIAIDDAGVLRFRVGAVRLEVEPKGE